MLHMDFLLFVFWIYGHLFYGYSFLQLGHQVPNWQTLGISIIPIVLAILFRGSFHATFDFITSSISYLIILDIKTIFSSCHSILLLTIL